jgi:4-diphosphocytidyl-2-C-methyl-D-erythritol kinase
VSAAPIVISTPAKLNLGLEIIGKRADGYHDLETIFQAVEPMDRLSLARAADGMERLIVSDPLPGGPDNLAWRALGLLRAEFGATGTVPVEARLEKAIPAAAGMGGASSDAAAALLAGREFWDLPARHEELARIAAALGSDVPFFLRSGTAHATGRGEVLVPLPAPPAWFVIVSPDIPIERKTATLYGALRPEDFSNGAAVREQARRISSGLPIDPALLVNAFTRPLVAIRPDVTDVRDAITRAGGQPALSGAGPTHFAVFRDPEEARMVAFRLRDRLGPKVPVFVSPALPPRGEMGPDSASTD